MAKLRNSNKESAFRKNLRKLFSGDVLVDMGGGNRKRLDVDSSSKSSTYASYTDKIKRSKRTYLPRLNNSFNRTKLFRKYEQMDRDSIISSALDIYADESTTKNSEGNMLSIKSDNNNIVKHLNVLYYQILNIEFNLWTWIRTMVKYGDCFTYNIVEKNKGIINTHFISNYDIERQEEDDEIKFKLLNGIKINDGNQDRETLYNFEVSHFRLLNDNNYLPYGRSLLEGTRKTWEQLILMEDAMLLHRIMRSPERRKYKIDVSNIPPKDVDAYMEEIINSVKKTPYIDEQTGEYNLRYNLESSIDDIFLPVRGDRSGNEVETLSGLDWNGIDDIEYLKNKMMASLKIPKPFLGYDESVEGKSTLASMDLRFARTIEYVQRIVESELKKMGVVHLYALGFGAEDVLNFDISLTNPSIIYEQEKVSLLSEKIRLAQDMADSQMFSFKDIYQRVFDMSAEDLEQNKKDIIRDYKFKFRLEQLEREGNDPQETKQSVGTPHDLAMLNYSEPGEPGAPKGGFEDSGRPPEGTKYNTQNHPHGRNSLGKDSYKKVSTRNDRSSKVKHDFKSGKPLALENERIKKENIMEMMFGSKKNKT